MKEQFSDAWAKEKTENIIKDLFSILNVIDGRTSLDERLPWDSTVRQHINDSISSAFHDLTKLLSCAYSSNRWSFEDRDQLMSFREIGLGMLIGKYKAEDIRQ